MKPKALTEQDVLALSGGLDEPAWLRDRRQEAFKAFSDLEWPHNRIEEWRYTNPALFDLERPVLTAGSDGPPPDRGIVASLGDDRDGAARVTDGGSVHATVHPDAARRGVVVADLASAAHRHADLVAEHLGSVVRAEQKFDALNLAAFTAGVFIYVPPEVRLERPITVTVQAAEPGTALPRVLAVVDRFAKADIYIDHVGDAPATVVEAVEVVAGDSAQVNLVTSQDWGEQVDHIGSHRGSVSHDAVYRHLEATLGGRVVYLRPDVGLEGEGSRAELLGAYFGAGEQRMEHRSVIHHNASRTSSEALYKGALQGHARATWFGNIRIEPHAKATSSDETNRNLILTDGAFADSIPFLEILCSDVIQCGHHSSVGQVDEVQLFYLMSRGIPWAEAVRMLVFGFFAEVTDRIELPGVSETILAEIAAEIGSGELALMDPRRTRRVPS